MTSEELAQSIEIVRADIAAARKPRDLEPVIFSVILRRIAFLERLREPLRKVSPLNAAIMQSWDDFDILVGRRLKDLAHRQSNPAGDGLPAST